MTRVAAASRPRLPRRNGHRQHHGCGRDRGGAVRRRRQRAGPVAALASTTRALRASARSIDPALARHADASAIRYASRPRLADASSPPSSAPRWRHASIAFRCCSTASSAPRRLHRSPSCAPIRSATRLRAIVSAEAGHRFLLEALGLPRCSISTCGSAKPRARRVAMLLAACGARLPHRHGDVCRGRRVGQPPDEASETQAG